MPVGRYLVGDDDRIAYRIDPGVCGTEPSQRGPDGRVEKVVTKFDAPKAQLFRLIIDGVLGGELPWGLVLLGVAIAIVMELCGVSSLPFAVGVYIPLATTAAIALGGLVRRLAAGARRERRRGRRVAGHALRVGPDRGRRARGARASRCSRASTSRWSGADGVVRPVSLVAHYGLALAPRLLGEETAPRARRERDVDARAAPLARAAARRRGHAPPARGGRVRMAARRIAALGVVLAALWPPASEAGDAPLGARQAAIFQLTCAQCHARPGLGVPQVGDAAAWTERAARGEETLLANTIAGLRGMPPLGTCSFCSEEDLRLLIRFLTGATKP